jgi:hypothetical protein
MENFETMNRTLENVLYYLGVNHLESYKNIDGMTVWVYPNTEKVRQIVGWFRESMENHQFGR